MIRFLVPIVFTLSIQAQPRLALREIATGLFRPVAIAHAGDARLFITLQRGFILVYDGRQMLPEYFLDISHLTSFCCLEQGMLSVAFHPRYRQNGYFYVNYTDVAGDTVVARYSVSSTDPNRADPDSAFVLLRVDQPFPNHNGGDLEFGPDGYLYITLGDGGGLNPADGDPNNRAQDLDDPLGKILRIDVDGPAPYGIPLSNPFRAVADARPEIWAWGLRNPWRLTFDRATGDAWIADVGQLKWEEVNLQRASSPAGLNYGWRRMEGTHCYNPATDCQLPGMVLPILEYGHENGDCSVTGGYRYRGRYPYMKGIYFYGDFCSGNIWGATEREDGTWRSELLLSTSMMITTFGEDSGGELYVAGLNGELYQLIDTTPLPPRRRAAGR